MAKNGRLRKLKCILKRWNSSLARTSAGEAADPTTTSAAADDAPPTDTWRHSSSFSGRDEVPTGYEPVYVGKSRRRYLIGAHLVGHPVFQNLLESASPAVVGCEVVLFDHLLWMLENADPKPESLDDLVDFYACC